VTGPGAIAGVKGLIRRFAAPVICAWLLHMGIWLFIALVAEPSVMSILTKTVNWFTLHFTARAWPIEEMSWPSRLTAFEIAEGFVPILIGLMIGWLVLRRKARIPKASQQALS
jgi:hypothetical protein